VCPELEKRLDAAETRYPIMQNWRADLIAQQCGIGCVCYYSPTYVSNIGSKPAAPSIHLNDIQRANMPIACNR